MKYNYLYKGAKNLQIPQNTYFFQLLLRRIITKEKRLMQPSISSLLNPV